MEIVGEKNMVCFMILHYKNYEVTKNCIESIKKIMRPEDKVIVLDNGSKNQSKDLLDQKYACDSQIEIYVTPNDENLGFSKCNNFGYIIAKKYNPDFLININNDIIFDQDDFIEKLYRIYDETDFYVCGPDVYVEKKMEHQSPYRLNTLTKEDAEKTIENCEKELERINSLVLYAKVSNFVSGFLPQRIKYNRQCERMKQLEKNRQEQGLSYKEKAEGVCITGSCIIFSKLFMNQEEKLYDPEPFFYGEEEFLQYRCIKKKMKLIYTPDLQVKHLQGESIRSSFGSLKKSFIFVNENMINSKKMYIEMLEKECKLSR